MDACLGWTPFQWFGIAEGYRKGAAILVSHIGEHFSGQDHLNYPIVFLYRHALEVSLKHLIYQAWELTETRADERAKTEHHNLERLWKTARPLLEEVWPEGPKDDLVALEETLIQFHDRDGRATAFRYPANGSVRKSENIDIQNFAAVAEKAFNMLDGCISGICAYLDNLREMQSEYYR